MSPNGMRGLSKDSVDKTNQELQATEASLLKTTDVDLATLRPQISDKASFDALVSAVEESTRQNESIAQLKDRLQALGSGVLAVAKEAAALLPAL
jgi:hypothetical protein